MKQLLILSGKGGTGKTTIASAFIKFSGAKAFADCDVDAPNLHLIMNPSPEVKRSNFYGMPKAAIDPGLCIQCDICIQNCRFEAIQAAIEYKVDDYACEGCGVCEALCPVGAVFFKPALTGELMLYSGEAVFSTAQLEMGSGNSGKLVTEVKKQMRTASTDVELAIIDGSPGIGCPVIASLSGVDMVLIVTEPTISGLNDMDRIIKTAEQFRTRVAICVNRFDTNLENTQKIEAFCQKYNFPYVGRIPYDPVAVKAINSGLSIAELDCHAGRAAKDIFDKTICLLFAESNQTGKNYGLQFHGLS